MTGTLILLNIAGAVALLLWGTHMVTTGVARGFGVELRNLIGKGLRNRVQAVFAGLVVTAVLQSSTATAMIASAFAASGYLDVTTGLAVMLGANIGTALIVRLLTFDITAIAPALILIGFVLYRTQSERARPLNLGRALLGLGLMLTALSRLVHLLASVESAPILRGVIHALSQEVVLAVLVAAVLAWAAHSSVATVLFIVSLASSGGVSDSGVMALILGANLGAAVSPVLEGSGSPAGRRIPMGNLIVRGVGCVVLLPFLPWLAAMLGRVVAVDDPPTVAIAFHIAFNAAIALVALPLTGKLAHLVGVLIPDPPARSEDEASELPHHLDEAALATPSLALANATLEALHLADLAAAILRDALPALRSGDRTIAAAIGQRDRLIDRNGLAVRHYLAELGGDEEVFVADDEQQRAQEILSFVLNIEHVGDIVSNNLVEFASRRHTEAGRSFSAEEMQDVERLHRETLASLQLALTVFLRDDVSVARQVIQRKEFVRSLERSAIDLHFNRMRTVKGNVAELAEASGVFLRTLRDLRRVHSHIAALCYPLLERDNIAADREEGGGMRLTAQPITAVADTPLTLGAP